MKITYYGQNSMSINIEGTTILIDPFITENKLAKNKVDINDLEADYIFLTHAHFDHTLDTEAIAKNTKAKIVASFEVATHFENKDLEVMPMNQGGTRSFSFGQVKCVSAIHSSSFQDGSYGGNPLGFLIMTNSKNIYIAGDTALTMDMKLIPMFTSLDLAILPIGDTVTMGADDAILASDFVQCDRVLGVHYNTLSFLEIDKDDVSQKFKKADKELILLEVNESLSV